MYLGLVAGSLFSDVIFKGAIKTMPRDETLGGPVSSI